MKVPLAEGVQTRLLELEHMIFIAELLRDCFLICHGACFAIIARIPV